MHIRALTGLALSGALVLAGCVQDRASEPLLPTEVSLAASPAACSWSDMGKAAKAYFSSTKDPVYALLTAYQAAYRTANPATISAAAFDVLARIGVATDAKLVKTAAEAQGSILANLVIACNEAPAAWTSVDFSKALKADGLFAVRPATSSTGVFSRHVGGPLYGAEPMPGAGSWPMAGTTLFFGYTLSTTEFDEFTLETDVSTTFELNTYPLAQTFTKDIRAGVCNSTSASARIFHQHGLADVILQSTGTPSFCAVQHDESVGFASVARRVVDLFLPQPLHAAMFTHGASGGLKSLSPIGAVTFDASQVALNFDVQPKNAAVSDTESQFEPPVTVSAKTALILDGTGAVVGGGTPLGDVLVTLVVVGNQGSFKVVGDTATTNNLGIATFSNFYIDKPGGYTITATGKINNSSTLSKLGNFFTISGQ